MSFLLILVVDVLSCMVDWGVELGILECVKVWNGCEGSTHPNANYTGLLEWECEELVYFDELVRDVYVLSR